RRRAHCRPWWVGRGLSDRRGGSGFGPMLNRRPPGLHHPIYALRLRCRGCAVHRRSYARRRLHRAWSLPMILALLLALLPQEKPVYRLADYVQEATDCAQRGSYGGQNRVLCDLAAPMKRALADCYASASTWAGDSDVQCEIEGPSGLFYWASQVDLCHG